MPVSKQTGYLYVSFWHICLESFPEGLISHRLIKSREASVLINKARARKKLFCVTMDGSEILRKSTKRREKSSHQQLCVVLKRLCNITISPRDFLHEWKGGKTVELAPFPLNGIAMKPQDRLLVINNIYLVDRSKNVKVASILLHGTVAE